MGWKETCVMEERFRFIEEYRTDDWSFSELCRRFGVSRKTGYKWLNRYKAGGKEALAERSRRPRRSPGQMTPAVAAEVIALRRETTWGGRKLRQRLQQLGHRKVPAA